MVISERHHQLHDLLNRLALRKESISQLQNRYQGFAIFGQCLAFYSGCHLSRDMRWQSVGWAVLQLKLGCGFLRRWGQIRR
ncbi:MAG: hypothetical protein ACFB0C_13340 [Leptolyngbyaceae cyanobacterium]